MTTTVGNIGGSEGSDEAFPKTLLKNKKKPVKRNKLMENFGKENEELYTDMNLDGEENNDFLDMEDNNDDFNGAESLDEEGFDEEQQPDLSAGPVTLNAGDGKKVTINMEEDENFGTEESYEDSITEGDTISTGNIPPAGGDLNTESAKLSLKKESTEECESEEEEEDDEDFDTMIESFVKSVSHSPAQSPVHNIDKARQNQPGKPASKPNKDQSNSSPDESIEDANQHAKTEKPKGRDVDLSPKGPAVKRDVAQSPTHNIDKARQNASKGLVANKPVDDGQTNRLKDDGKKTHEKIAPKNLSYETFMAKADAVFSESFDQNFRNAARKK